MSDALVGVGDLFGPGPVAVEVEVGFSASCGCLGCDVEDAGAECAGFGFGEFAVEPELLCPAGECHGDEGGVEPGLVCWGVPGWLTGRSGGFPASDSVLDSCVLTVTKFEFSSAAVAGVGEAEGVAQALDLVEQ